MRAVSLRIPDSEGAKTAQCPTARGSEETSNPRVHRGIKSYLRVFHELFRRTATKWLYPKRKMTKEDRILVFLKLQGGSGSIDTIREAADIREAAILRQSNPLAKKLIADGLILHPRRNHYVLTARGKARASELIGGAAGSG